MLNCGAVIAQNNITLRINDEIITPSIDPYIKNGTTLVPLRVVSEELGAKIDWNDENKTITLRSNKGTTISLKIGDINASIITPTGENKQYNLNVAPEIVNGTTMVPIRFISENMDCAVNWNANNKIVDIVETENNGYNRTNPAPVGTTLIDFGERTGTKAVITLLSVERGDSVFQKLYESNRYNDLPKDGNEYIAAKFKITLNNIPNDQSIEVTKYLFTAFSSDNAEYPRAPYLSFSNKLEGQIYNEGTLEGYIIFEVSKEDKSPVVVFDPNQDGTGGAWFKLDASTYSSDIIKQNKRINTSVSNNINTQQTVVNSSNVSNTVLDKTPVKVLESNESGEYEWIEKYSYEVESSNETPKVKVPYRTEDGSWQYRYE